MRPFETLAARIGQRVEAMLGGVDRGGRTLGGRRLRRLAHRVPGHRLPELARHLAGELSLEDAVRQTVKRTRTLARRQLAWFRRDPRIRWFDVGDDGAIEAVDRIVAHLEDA